MSAFFFAHPKETDLALFAGGELGPFARWRIERHLETCSACKRSVADYFHLADELSVLAETPEMDWSAMAGGIQARLVAEGPQAEVRAGLPGWTWQLGAAAACAMVAMAVLHVGPQAEKAQAPAPEQVIAEDRAAVASGPIAPAADPPMELDLADAAAQAPARQFVRLEAEALHDQRQPEPLLEKKKESAAPEELAASNRADELSTDAAAPAPPAAKVLGAQSESSLVAQASGARDSFEGARRMRSATPPASVAAGAVAGVAAHAPDEQLVSFTVMPLPDDRQVGADGWVSIRRVSADGAMTITDVYEPQ